MGKPLNVWGLHRDIVYKNDEGKGSVNGIVIFNFPSLCLKGSHAF